MFIMTKMLRDYPIYLAPKIQGQIINGIAEIFDEEKNEFYDPDTIDGKINIYERQVKGWFLEVGSRLLLEDPI